MHAGQETDLVGVDAAGVHDVLALDRSLIGLDGAHAIVRRRATPVTRVFVRIVAPRCRAPLAKRERQLARIDVAVRGQQRRAEHALGRHRREHRLRLVGRDEVEREAEGLGPGGLALELFHVLFGRRQSQRSDLAPPGLEVDLLAQGPVEVDRVHHHLRERQRVAKLADQSGRMERRAAGQLGAFDEHHVAPAQASQPVEDRTAADSRHR